MHILLSVNAAWNIWNFRRPLVEALLADGHSVTVLAPRDETASGLEAIGCRFRPLAMSAKGISPVECLRFQTAIRAALRDERPDVVLSYTIKNNIFGALAARSLGIPFIPNVTGLGTAFLSGGLLQSVAERLYRHAFARLPVVFFQNEDDRGFFIAKGLVAPSQARVLPGSGIDLRHFSPWPCAADPGRPTFLMIARLLRDKGVHEYVEAAREVRRRIPQARFQLLGSASADNRSAIDPETLRGWVAAGDVEYLGTTADVRPYIAQAACVVLPSYREGAPRTLIEAAAMARPTIATDVPGCRSVIEPGVSGLLCAPKDARDLAATVLRFLSLSEDRRRAMGLAGRRRMEQRYGQEIVVAEYRAAIRDILGPRPPRLAHAV